MDWKLQLTGLWTAAGAALYLLEPDAAPFILPLALAMPFLWIGRVAFFANASSGMSWLSALLAVTAVYLLVNASWSLVPSRAYIAVIIFVVLALVLHTLIRVLPHTPPKALRAMAIGFYAGYAICAALLAIEIILDHPIHLWLFKLLPRLAPHVDDAASAASALPDHFLNRNIAALTILLWSALLVSAHIATSRTFGVLLGVCLLPVLPAVYLSAHETSKVAIVGGGVAFLIARFAPRVAGPLLILAWLVACTSVLPLATLAYDAELHQAKWLPASAQHRIVIWAVTSAQVAEAPVLGHGLVSSREIGKEQTLHANNAPSTNFPMSLGPHAHNAFLQAWFDTGVLGVALLLGLGFAVLHAISRSSPRVQATLYAIFATVMLLAASSFSLWARWYLASFGVATLFALLATSFAECKEPVAEPDALISEQVTS